jgi:hypothetical protein
MRFARIVLALPFVFILPSHAFAQAPAAVVAAQSDPASLGFLGTVDVVLISSNGISWRASQPRSRSALRRRTWCCSI